jgi:hypothetical protein
MEPVRVTPAEGGWVLNEDFRVFRGHVSTNMERNAIMGMRAVMMAEMAPYVRTVCSSTLSRLTGEMGQALTRWATSTSAYQGRSWHPINQKFFITGDGLDATHWYNGTMNVMRPVRSCSLSNKSKCGANITPKLAAYLNLEVVNGQCVALPTPEPDTSSWSVPIEGTIIDGKRLFPKLDDASVVALEATHVQHHLASAFVCGDPVAVPVPGAVDAAHKRYESLASTPDEMHFRRIIDFSGANDPQWTSPERCAWKELQNLAHSGPNNTTLFDGQDISWARAQREGHTGKSEAAGALHRIFHICLNFKANYDVRFPFKPIDGAPDFRTVKQITCAEYLHQPGLMAELLKNHPQYQ